MSFAPLETQKAIYKLLSQSAALASVLGSSIPIAVQSLTFNKIPTMGNFRLTFAGTGPDFVVNYDDTAMILQDTIRLVTGFELVTVSGNFTTGFIFTYNGLPGPRALFTVSLNTLEDLDGAINVTAANVTAGSLEMVPQKVFEFVPDNFRAYPYVTFNIMPWNERSNRSWDGFSCEFQISVWDESRSSTKIHQVQYGIDKMINAKNICALGWNTISLRRTFIDVIRDPDNVTRQGIQRFNLLLGRNITT